MTIYTRRRFLATLGKGTASVAVLGVATIACGDDASPTTTSAVGVTPQSEDPTDGPTTAAAAQPATTAGDPAASSTIETGVTTEAVTGDAFSWERVNLGFVSAYVLERGGEAALVDTGVGGSEGEIEAALSALGLGWGNVGHVILTHSHPDHVGSIDAVLSAAPDAIGYIGEGDMGAVPTPQALQPLNDGDTVFDLHIIGTPGHTPGHISVFDPVSRLLVAGDALNESGGAPTGANPQFSDDMAMADESVLLLAALAPSTIVVGHGEPVAANAAQLLNDLAIGL